jgi:hypothetical protein
MIVSDDGGTVPPRASDHDRPSPLTSLLATDTTYAGYVIEGVAGRGGMGVVYRAHEAFPARTVALKVISPELAADAEFRARFVRESNLAATIEHPNVLPIFRAGEEAGLLYLAMRYVEGTDLAALIADRGRLEPRRAVEIVVAVCDALDAAHASGLVHRDVKPANVLIGRQGGKEHVYLTDFGIAKRSDATGGPTMTGSFMGTLDYAAPEQIQSGHVDARTDVYATGCLLYHALAGRVPFPADNAAARVFAHLSTEPPSLRDTDPTLPRQLDGVIHHAMAKDPNDRYLSAGDLGRAAKLALEGESLTRAERNVAAGAAAQDDQSTVEVDMRRIAKDIQRVAGQHPAPEVVPVRDDQPMPDARVSEAPAAIASDEWPPPPAAPARAVGRTVLPEEPGLKDTLSRRRRRYWVGGAAVVVVLLVGLVLARIFWGGSSTTQTTNPGGLTAGYDTLGQCSDAAGPNKCYANGVRWYEMGTGPTAGQTDASPGVTETPAGFDTLGQCSDAAGPNKCYANGDRWYEMGTGPTAGQTDASPGVTDTTTG